MKIDFGQKIETLSEEKFLVRSYHHLEQLQHQVKSQKDKTGLEEYTK